MMNFLFDILCWIVIWVIVLVMPMSLISLCLLPLTLCDDDDSIENVILFLLFSMICVLFVVPIWCWLT